MREAGEDANAFLQPDLQFHTLLLEASHNELLEHMSTIVTAVLRTLFTYSGRPPGAYARAAEQHRAVVDAIGEHDPDGAESALLALSVETTDSIAWALENGAGPTSALRRARTRSHPECGRRTRGLVRHRQPAPLRGRRAVNGGGACTKHRGLARRRGPDSGARRRHARRDDTRRDPPSCASRPRPRTTCVGRDRVDAHVLAREDVDRRPHRPAESRCSTSTRSSTGSCPGRRSTWTS